MTILADVLDCPVEYLLSDQPSIVSGIYEKSGKDRSYIFKNLLLDIEAYFSCDYIGQEEKDTFSKFIGYALILRNYTCLYKFIQCILFKQSYPLFFINIDYSN